MATENTELTDNLLLARAHGRSFFQQVMDILRLALQRRGMTAEDYYWFAMYDENWSDVERGRMIGDSWAPQAIAKTCRSDWWAIGKDKVLNYILLKAYGFDVPNVRAIYHPMRPYPDAAHLRDREQLVTWLRTECPYPQFAKPVTGVMSKGQSLLVSYDADNDMIERLADDPISVDAYADIVCSMEGLTHDDGFLFQDLLEPDSRIEHLIGRRLAGVRTIVIIESTGPRIIHAVSKIPVGDNFADNYWREGNLLADLDVETGEVLRLMTGWGGDLQEITKHPDTDAVLVGERIPDWDKVRQITLRGAVTMPKLMLQGWDIGVCEGGPKVIEANLGSGFKLPQLAERKGFMDPDFEKFLEWADAKIKAEGFGDFA